MIEPNCLIHRAQPLRRRRTGGWELDLHPQISLVVEDRLDEHLEERLEEDIWSFVEGDDEDFSAIDQRQRLIQELQGECAQTTSEHELVDQNNYKYVQYKVQMYYDTEHRSASHQTSAQNPTLFSDASSSSSSRRSAHHCSTCTAAHTQESVVDPSYPPMRVWGKTRSKGTEHKKRLSS